MGLFLTLLYILTAYLGPETLWGPLYEFHIEIILAALAFAASVPAIQRSKLFSIPQSYALVGMCIAVFCSMVMTGWLGSILPAVLGFIPNAFTFFLVVVNCRTKRHLQLLVLTMLIFCAFPIYKGYTALHAGNFSSPYLMPQGSDEGGFFYRLRGMAFINDPNDFAQVMVSLIPCLFFLWKKRSPMNFLFVLPAAALLIFGMYLTHSRGGIIAFLAVLLFAFRRKIGTIPSAVMAAGFFALTSVVNWSGGRDVSVEAGAGRMEAWAVGLDLIKAHPIFGVGFGRFGEYFFITAHNTIVVCAAELGMFGLFWWVMFVLPTIRDAMVCSQGKKLKPVEEDSFSYDRAYGVQQGSSAPLRREPAEYAAREMSAPTALTIEADLPGRYSIPAGVPLHLATADEEDPKLPPEEVRRISHLMLTSIVGYFVAGWFLSRAYIMTLFIYGGMAQVIYRMALAQDLAPPRMKPLKIVQYAAIGSVGLIFVVYIMLRLQHLTSH
ncbi:O-antigen ligase family protein [Edaphobacter albus]|uniref:O-antigen ligase family protein n=1 Tax=Edaphobacter sp. 4G125 TaxID=2763071 RepID=UPI001647CC90|nr:O-antigen ligase family protein [Edaphobacter sp. 4G125]QNI36583.1 O-antigen ligase family protein [Edaphobacter sp. 4G125]